MTSTSRVGLGSPAIDFSPRWAGQHRRETSFRPEEPTSTPPQLDRTSSIFSASSPGKTGTVLDHETGLPSPPGTNSDVALPTPFHEVPNEPSLMNESPPATLAPRDPLSRSSSFRARPLFNRSPSMASSTSGSANSENRIRALRPISSVGSRGGSPASTSKAGGSSHSLSRSMSSSAHSPLRPKSKGTASASPGTPASRSASLDLPRHSLSSGQSNRHSVQLERSNLRSSTSSTNSSRHHHSPSAPVAPSSPVRSVSPVKRHSGIYAPPAAGSSPRGPPNAAQRKGKRVSSGSELDGQIREVEEKIRQAASRRGASRSAGHYPSTSPTRPPQLHRHDPYSRARGPLADPPREVYDDSSLHRTFSKTSLADSPLEELSESGVLEDPPSSATYRQETYRRAAAPSFAQHLHNGHETMRRSATVSSAASSARTPGAIEQDPRDEEQEKSGGSGGSRHRKPLPTSFRNGHSSLFTPSPKTPQDSMHSPHHAHLTSPTAPLSRFSTTSRLSREQSVPSPSSPSRFRPVGDGLERPSSVSSRIDRRQWSESVSGLPRRYGDELNTRGPSGLPRPDVGDRNRAEGLADDAFANSRFSRDREIGPRLSRLSLAPGDSVSAVGTRSERPTPTSNKDPLEVLKRIEAQRNEHNRQWDAERSASVLGDRPGSGSRIDMSPQRETRMRPATSMSSLREQSHAPRTAPIDRIRRDFEHDSPLQRSSSRLSHIGVPHTEPRPMRSSTSLGGRSSASLDVHSASSEHGRLLYEAARALEVKIPSELSHAVPDIGRTFGSAARSAESNNAVIRAALHMASQLCVEAETNSDLERILRELGALLGLLREATRTSDHNVRDLTRVLLDVPKMLREASRRADHPQGSSMSTAGSVRNFGTGGYVNGGYHTAGYGTYDRERDRSNGSPYSSPVRRSADLPRPSTAASDIYSPERRRTRESLPANFVSGESRGSGLMSRMRNLGRSRDNLATIQDSPPKAFIEPAQIDRPPPSPARRMLRKKASSTSTHTVRAGSNFMPSSTRVPTTAISAVTADPGSPMTGEFDTRSIRSVRSRRDSQDFEAFVASSPSKSRTSFHTAREASLSSSADARRDTDATEAEDGVLAEGEDELLTGLVEAQRRREESESGQGEKSLARSASLASRGSEASSSRKWSVSDRFKATLRRG